MVPMKGLKLLGMLLFVASIVCVVVLMAGGVTGVLKILLGLLLVPVLIVLLTPRFWLGFFAGDVLRVLFSGRRRR